MRIEIIEIESDIEIIENLSADNHLARTAVINIDSDTDEDIIDAWYRHWRGD